MNWIDTTDSNTMSLKKLSSSIGNYTINCMIGLFHVYNNDYTCIGDYANLEDAQNAAKLHFEGNMIAFNKIEKHPLWNY